MTFSHPRSAAACLLAVTTLFGCSTAPKDTWVNKGPSEIVTSPTQRVCYSDANIINGERVFGMVCAIPKSGFMGNGEPMILAGPAYHLLTKVLFSDAAKGANVPLYNKTGLLQCTPLKAKVGSSFQESLCTVTVNGQMVVSTKITFANE